MFELLLVIAPTFSCSEVNQLLANLERAEGMTPQEKREVAREFINVAPQGCELHHSSCETI